MTDHQPAKTKLRYRAYYWLCFTSFVAIVIGLANEANRAVTGYDAFAFETTLQIVIGLPLALLATIMPALLIAIPSGAMSTPSPSGSGPSALWRLDLRPLLRFCLSQLGFSILCSDGRNRLRFSHGSATRL